MPSPHGAGGNNENLESLLVARHACEGKFKNMNTRESEFRKQKLVLLDKELQIRKIARERDESPTRDSTMKPNASTPSKGGGGARPTSGHQRSPVASQRTYKADSPQRSRSSPSFGSTWCPQSPSGLSVTRFAAALPVNHHPAIHPGAVVIHKDDLRRSKSTTSMAAFSQTGDAGSLGAGASPGGAMRQHLTLGDTMNSATTWKSSPPASPDHSHQRHGFDASLTALFTDTSPSSPSSPTVSRSRPQAKAFGRPDSPHSKSPARKDPGYEDLWFKGDSAESVILDNDERDAMMQTGGISKRGEDREVIDRLGGLMAILGPRYKTLSRDALWERARIGETTPLQRELARVGDAKKQQEADEKERRKKAKKAFRKDKPVSVADAPDDDPDGRPRAAWLVCRAREKEHRERQMQKSLGFLALNVKD